MPGPASKHCWRSRSASAYNGCTPGSYEFRNQIRASLPGEFLKMSPTAHQMYHPEVWGAGPARRSRSHCEALTRRPGFSQEAGLCPSWQECGVHQLSEVGALTIRHPVNSIFVINPLLAFL